MPYKLTQCLPFVIVLAIPWMGLRFTYRVNIEKSNDHIIFYFSTYIQELKKKKYS